MQTVAEEDGQYITWHSISNSLSTDNYRRYSTWGFIFNPTRRVLKSLFDYGFKTAKHLNYKRIS